MMGLISFTKILSLVRPSDMLASVIPDPLPVFFFSFLLDFFCTRRLLPDPRGRTAAETAEPFSHDTPLLLNRGNPPWDIVVRFSLFDQFSFFGSLAVIVSFIWPLLADLFLLCDTYSLFKWARKGPRSVSFRNLFASFVKISVDGRVTGPCSECLQYFLILL